MLRRRGAVLELICRLSSVFSFCFEWRCSASMVSLGLGKHMVTVRMVGKHLLGSFCVYSAPVFRPFSLSLLFRPVLPIFFLLLLSVLLIPSYSSYRKS